MDIEQLRTKLEHHKQEHLIHFWSELEPKQQQDLYDELQALDFEDVLQTFKESTSSSNGSSGAIHDDLLEPIPSEVHESIMRVSSEKLTAYEEAGLTAIGEGKFGALLLAGGQGTRLGVNYPKGMFNVGLPSGKTLYQLQAERICRLEELSGKRSTIPWYIMTSEATSEPTAEYFKANDYFGLEPKNVIIFEQSLLPCFDFEGKLLLGTKSSLAKAPDGNGGLYLALRKSGALKDMAERGLEALHVYCVDNILVKVVDPVFMGYCRSKKAEAGAKVVEKTSPTESVGIIAKVEGKYKVVEYSEVSEAIASRRDPTDGSRLQFNAGNICNHYFTLGFLQNMATQKLRHHVANKKIPFVAQSGELIKPTSPNGIKLEKFVFDVFEFAKKFVVWEVLREDEFSPLKNGASATKDTALTARQALFAQHARFITNAGGLFVSNVAESEQVCEISPLLSYAGEGLNKLVSGKKFEFPCVLYADNEPQAKNGTESASCGVK